MAMSLESYVSFYHARHAPVNLCTWFAMHQGRPGPQTRTEANWGELKLTFVQWPTADCLHKATASRQPRHMQQASPASRTFLSVVLLRLLHTLRACLHTVGCAPPNPFLAAGFVWSLFTLHRTPPSLALLAPNLSLGPPVPSNASPLPLQVSPVTRKRAAHAFTGRLLPVQLHRKLKSPGGSAARHSYLTRVFSSTSSLRFYFTFIC